LAFCFWIVIAEFVPWFTLVLLPSFQIEVMMSEMMAGTKK
jgi:hypothetical protein